MPFFNIFSNTEDKKQKEEKLPKIVIDNREKNSLVPSEISKRGFQIEFRQLEIGDYLIGNVAVERKTVADLKSSIINKRIFSQLLEIKKFEKGILIIEGEIEELYDNNVLHENAVRGFLLSVGINYSVPVIFSSDERETALFISILSRKKENEEISLRPSRNFKTKKEQLQFILEGFSGIGPVKARALIEKFGSLRAIVGASESELKEILGARTTQFLEMIS